MKDLKAVGEEHRKQEISELEPSNLELKAALRDLVVRLAGPNDIGLRGMSRSQIISIEAAKALLARSS